MLIKADANLLEWRVISWLSGDEVALGELYDKDTNPNDPDKDFHTKNQKTFNLPSRLIAKTYLFRTIYRGSGYSFATDHRFIHVSADPSFWDDVNEKFYKKYKGIDRCHNNWAQLVAQRKPIVSPIGREWLIQMTEDGKLPWTVFTNYPVQGTGNDIMAIARISLSHRMKRSGLKSLLVSTVHDDIKVDCIPGEEKMVGNAIQEAFDAIPQNFKKIYGVELPCKFPCEIKIGKNLKEMKLLTF